MNVSNFRDVLVDDRNRGRSLFFRLQWCFSLAIALAGLAATSQLCFSQPLNEISERRVIDAEVQVLWHNDDFDALQHLAEKWRVNRERTQSGFWKLPLFYAAFEDLQKPALVGDYPAGLAWARLDRWMSQYPNSATPILVKTGLLLIQAQKADPWEVYSNVGVAPWHPNVDLLQGARELLEQNKTKASEEPYWHTLYLRLMRLEARSDDEILIAHAEALDAHPLFEQTSLETFDYFIDRWAPNFKLIDGFANTVVERTKNLTGMAGYARLYEQALPKFRKGQYFSVRNRDWNKMNAGLDVIDRNYPSPWNTHQHAMHACIAQDLQTAREQFARADDTQASLVWQDAIMFKQCKRWAAEAR